mgnify:CR=1 FL=1
MTGPRTLRSLSTPRQRLVRLLQSINYGRLEQLLVRDGEPVFEPPPCIRREVVFGKANSPNPAKRMEDFVLKEHLVELFELFDQQRSVTIDSLVVQDGLPVRMSVLEIARVA